MGGPALPFLYLVPESSRSHWFTRIVIEPVALFVGSIFLQNAFIVQPGLGTYLRMVAVALVMKNFIVWYRAWEFMPRHSRQPAHGPDGRGPFAEQGKRSGSGQDPFRKFSEGVSRDASGMVARLMNALGSAPTQPNSEANPAKEGTV